MYCSQCGKEISGDARYCSNCGARQEMGVVRAEGICAAELSDKKKRRAHRQGRRLGNLLITIIALLILFTADEEIPTVGLYTPQQIGRAHV